MTVAWLGQNRGSVLVASADSVLRQQLINSLHGRNGAVGEATGGADVLSQLEIADYQLLLLDPRLPDLDPDEVSELVRLRHPGVEVVRINPAGQVGIAESEEGARKPPAAFSRTESKADCAGSCSDALPGMVGTSLAMQRVYRLSRLVAPRTTTVLIQGPTGAGKELVAHGIHALSLRREHPFVTVNCAALPEALVESELFGHVRGAFTGAVQTYAGRVVAAQGGTLFLDEIGELPLASQAKLLRFLEQKEVQRLGSSETAKVDVRVLAATNGELTEKVANKEFREDLYYRLSAFPVRVPALRERGKDIALLAEYFLAQIQGGGKPPVLVREALRQMEDYSWPGNVRELQQALERACILAEGEPTIRPEHFVFTSYQWTDRRTPESYVASFND